MFEVVHRTSLFVDMIVVTTSMLPGKAVAPRDIHIDQGRAEGQVHILIMLMAPWGHVRDRSHCFLSYRPGFEGCIPKSATTLALRAFSTSGYPLIGQSRGAAPTYCKSST